MRLVCRFWSIPSICAVALATACGPVTAGGPPKYLTVLPTDRYDVFPDLHGAVGDSSFCAAASTPDSTVPYQRVTANSHYVGALSLRLPSIYAVLRQGGLGSEMFGGMQVAEWMVAADVARNRAQPGTRTPTRSVIVWVGPESGVPTVGAAPGTRQTSVLQCSPANAARRTHVALFTLAGKKDTTAYLAAVWPSPGGRYLQLVATAASLSDLLPVQRALLDARSEPARNR